MDWIKIFEPQSLQQLIENWKENEPLRGTREERDYQPAAKLFLPWTSGTWLLTECDDDGLAFGLCDLGMGTPELGYVSLDELLAIRGPAGLRVEQDVFFKASKPISQYADEAMAQGRITA